MRLHHAPTIVFLLLCLLGAGAMAYYLPMLPDRLATHFDASGRANGWSSQADFIKAVAKTIAVLAAAFVGASLMNRIPSEFINLPNKDSWLAPGQREATLAFIRDWLRWLLVLALAVLSLLNGMTLRANLVAPPTLPDNMVWLMVGFAAVAVVMTVALIRRFVAKPTSPNR